MTTIHYSEMPDMREGHPLFLSWTTYRRELPRLLEEGHEGKFILIKGSEIIGLYDTHDDAYETALKRFGRGGYYIHQIRTWEPVYRTRAV